MYLRATARLAVWNAERFTETLSNSVDIGYKDPFVIKTILNLRTNRYCQTDHFRCGPGTPGTPGTPTRIPTEISSMRPPAASIPGHWPQNPPPGFRVKILKGFPTLQVQKV